MATVVRDDGTPAVIKPLMPRDGGATRHEITALALAAGAGCATLLEHDVSRKALLLERLGKPLAELDLPLSRHHELLVAAAQRIWRRAPGSGLPTGAEMGAWLIGNIMTWWDELDQPCPERVISHAIDCAERRIAAHDDAHAGWCTVTCTSGTLLKRRTASSSWIRTACSQNPSTNSGY